MHCHLLSTRSTKKMFYAAYAPFLRQWSEGVWVDPGHLKELLALPWTQSERVLLDGLSTLANKRATGNVPYNLMKWLAGTPLTPLRKRDGGVHPVAVGETIWRVLSSYFLASLEISGTSTSLSGNQGWYWSCPACDEPPPQTLLTRPARAVLQVDLLNDLNLVNLHAIISVLRRKFPGLYRWVVLCYNSAYYLICTGYFQFNSVTGVQQGDPRRWSLWNIRSHTGRFLLIFTLTTASWFLAMKSCVPLSNFSARNTSKTSAFTSPLTSALSVPTDPGAEVKSVYPRQ